MNGREPQAEASTSRGLRRAESLGYRSLEIFRDQELGHGSYGAVYKAKCDDLPCAAKVLHPMLAHSLGGVGSVPLMKFRQECAFLESIRHPNIVLYLGVSIDPENPDLPVLLMELLDESLTSMLESSLDPLPHHIQVDIGYDVSLAISYLHSNDIIHRDLSSNNVLITAKRKAKVTDFGVSRLVDLEHHSSTPLSLCPGTKAYMPPEALQGNPSGTCKYSEKIDIFSLGVILIQLITRLFPDPTSATEEVDTSYARGQRLQKIISEVDRRKNHINLIDPGNPLLDISIVCLRDEQSKRPNASELCRMLADLKLYQGYSESKQQDYLFGTAPTAGGGAGHLYRSIETNGSLESSSLKKKLFEKEKQLTDMSLSIRKQEESLRTQRLDLDSKQQELVGFSNRVRELQQSNRMLLSELQRKDELLQHKTAEATELQNHLSKTQKEWEEYGRVVEEMRRLKVDNERMIGEHLTEMALKKNEIDRLKEKVRESERITANFQMSLETRYRSTSLNSPTDFSPTLTSPLNSIGRRSSLEKLNMNWRHVEGSPSSIYRGTAVYHDEMVYLACRSKVFAYSTRGQCWKQFVDAPQANGGFVVINDFPTIIGGEKNGRVVNTLVSLMDNTWIETFPTMPTPRVYSSAVVYKDHVNKHVIVAGGSLSTRLGEDIIKVVEVMEIGDLECTWFSVSSLCRPLADASTVVHNSQLMLIGGTDCSGSTVTNQRCSIHELLNTKRKVTKDQQRSPPLRQSSGSGSFVWRLMTDCKLQCSTGVVVKGQLLAIGGTSKDTGRNTCTSYVYRYNEVTDSWEKAGLMNNTRSHCFAVSLPGNELMVAGGYTGNPSTLTNLVEIATVS